MATFTVWRFDSAGGAERAVTTLQNLQSQELIKVHDAAVVRWPEGRKKPKTRQLHSLAGAGALGSAFWGLFQADLIHTNLSDEQDARLREVFTEAEDGQA